MVLTATDITNGYIDVVIANPGDGNTITVTANLTDVAGNVGPNSNTDTALLDLTDPSAPIVEITEDARVTSSKAPDQPGARSPSGGLGSDVSKHGHVC